VITGPISVTAPAGTTNSGSLLFYGLPVIGSFTPTNGFPGTLVTIIGTNFTAASAVKFNNVAAASFTNVNNGQINAVVPNTFTGPIVVTAPAGTASSATPFTLDFMSDLGIAVSATADPVILGNDLTYTIVITNGGPASAPNVMLTNTLPASVVLKNNFTSAGTLSTNGNQVIGSLGSLASPGTITITLVVAPQSAGTIFNATTVASSYTDPATANNSTNLAVVIYPVPQLAIQPYTATQVQISWPVALTNFVLQFRTNLINGSAWSDVATPPLTSGNQKFVIDPIDSVPRFYRLKR
jgi:uncharacterized repeat protein (TIGR01451 family)